MTTAPDNGVIVRNRFWLDVNGQIESFCGIGICDPASVGSRWGAAIGRYDTVAFRSQLSAAVSANATFLGGQVRTAFSTGVGETGVPTGIPGLVSRLKTTVDTNCGPNGAMTFSPWYFLLKGFSISYLGTVYSDAAGHEIIGPSLHQDSYYDQQIGQRILSNVFPVMRFEQSQCPIELMPAHYVQGLGNSTYLNTTKNGGNAMGFYYALPAAVVVGPTQDGNKLTLEMTLSEQFTVNNDPGNPLDCAVGAEDIPVPGSGDVCMLYAMVRILAIGQLVKIVDRSAAAAMASPVAAAANKLAASMSG